MGCDIHCYIEYKKPDYPGWRSFGGHINPGRNYLIFSNLAGVRNYREVTPVVSPRGYPVDAAWAASNDNWLYVTETEGDDHCTRERADYYVSQGSVYKDDDLIWVSNPDWHTHSWVTLEEFAKAIDGHDDEPQYRAVLAAMRSLEADGNETRLVFWFDN